MPDTFQDSGSFRWFRGGEVVRLCFSPRLGTLWCSGSMAQRAQIGEHLLAVGGRVHLGVDLGDMSRRIDQEGLALGHFHAQKIAQGAIGGCYLTSFIRQQWEGQLVLVGKCPVGGDIVHAHPQQRYLLLAECGMVISKALGFGGASRRIVLGIKVQDQPLAMVVGQAMDGAVLVGQGEIRRSSTQRWRGRPQQAGPQHDGHSQQKFHASIIGRFAAKAACASSDQGGDGIAYCTFKQTGAATFGNGAAQQGMVFYHHASQVIHAKCGQLR